MAMDLAGPGYHINRSNLLVLESKADMQKRGQASPDDGDALALTFAQTVAPPEKEEERRGRRVRRTQRDQWPGLVDAMSPNGTHRSLRLPSADLAADSRSGDRVQRDNKG